MAAPIHLIEANYNKNFPTALDEFPAVVDREHYIDAWQFNTIFASLGAIEQYLIDYKANVEAPVRNSFSGEDGDKVIAIPVGRYPAGKTCSAVDIGLVAGNIKKDITIFGVTGNLVALSGPIGVAIPVISVSPWAFPAPHTQSLNPNRIAVAVPTVSAT
jgi:hypothetical protein